MKATIVLIIGLFLAIAPVPVQAKEKMKDLRPLTFAPHLKTLNLSASSDYSFEDAMNRMERMKPIGYAISSIRYVRLKGRFIVNVSFVKVG